jgi:hypothetical protein
MPFQMALSRFRDISVEQFCFLTFRRPFSVYENEILEWHMGIFLGKPGDNPIKIDHKFLEDKKGRIVTETVLWNNDNPSISETAYFIIMCEAISRHFAAFTSQRKDEYFKGRTVGFAAENCAGLIMKALKLGFQSIGIEHSAYSGVRFTAFHVRDIYPYVCRMLQAGQSRLNGHIYDGFEEERSGDEIPTGYDFDNWQLKAERNSNDPVLYQDHVSTIVIPSHNATIDSRDSKNPESTIFRSELTSGHYVYVTEYGFRADSRCPAVVKSLGGMQPNSTRKDRQNSPIAFNLLDNFSHQASWGSDYSGYVSVTRSRNNALNFYRMQSGAGVGYIYAIRARDAIDVAATFKNPRYHEHEISVSGGIEWNDIVGWRKIDKGEWASPIFLSKNRITLPTDKRQAIYKVLSPRLRAPAKSP